LFIEHAKKINTFALDMLFPISCLFCRKTGDWVCQECEQKINLLSFQVCPYCEKTITQNGHICEKCALTQLEKNSPLSLDALLCATEYQKISKLVHLFKYNFIQTLGTPLGNLLTKILLKNNTPLPDIIIPVPIHKRKLKWRGFNQAEILANLVSQNIIPGLEIPICADALMRKKNTKPQMKIKTHKERSANLEGAFFVQPSKQKNISAKRILLIDDIATTGATLFTCAKTLKSFGAKEVFATVIARQKIERKK
jgi:ComF family protein